MNSGRRSTGDTWWWNEEVKEEFIYKKMHTKQCVGIVMSRIGTGINE